MKSKIGISPVLKGYSYQVVSLEDVGITVITAALKKGVSIRGCQHASTYRPGYVEVLTYDFGSNHKEGAGLEKFWPERLFSV